MMLQAYVGLNRTLFTHVRAPCTHIHLDSASDVKLLLMAHEVGIIPQPSRRDVECMLKNDIPMSHKHPLAKATVIIIG